jgi:predicted membrane protein
LSELQVDNLNAQSVMGRTEVTLPQQGFKQGRISMVMGQIVIYVPRNANLHITTNTALVPISLPSGFVRNGNDIVSTNSGGAQPMQLNISDVIGEVSILYP